MEKLSYNTLPENPGFILKNAPIKVLQFGEGNFLRAFVDHFVDEANEKAGFNGKVALIQPIEQGLAPMINEQEGLYTLYLRGFENGEKVNKKRLISCVKDCINPYSQFDKFLELAACPDVRFIVSNTTEAGIVYDKGAAFSDAPPKSFPAKLTRLLYERYKTLGERVTGLYILACELIDNNGSELKKCVYSHIADWGLEDGFKNWLDREVIFCPTLVDRIVTGYPRNEVNPLNEENGYEDNLIDTAEAFGLWVIEGPKALEDELPLAKAGMPVIVTNNHKPYKLRKVRILNGSHTSLFAAAYLAGKDIIRNCIEDSDISEYLTRMIFEEIIPTLTLPKEELTDFAESVLDRFRNPFIDHSLLSISLNSISKWRARVLPTVKDYAASEGVPPNCLTFGFAALIAFYRPVDESGTCKRADGTEYKANDDKEVLDFFIAHKSDSDRELAEAVCRNVSFWGEDLSRIPGFLDHTAYCLELIGKSPAAAIAEIAGVRND